MASTATTSTASSSSAGPSTVSEPAERRPQAGPLPSKRGEIGFNEAIHVQRHQESDIADAAAMPAIHPADRDAQRTQDSTNSAPPNTNTTAGTPRSAGHPVTTVPLPPSNDSSSTLAPKPRITRWYQWQNVPTYAGLRLTTLIRFALQVLLFGGTIAGWVIAIQHLVKSQKAASSSSDDSNDVNGILGPGMINLFIYVAFGVAVLIQLLFLERVVFHLRAERYVFLHPGEMFPSRRRGNGGGGGMMFMTSSSPGMSLAPWNRPPLPTYAAALAQNGLGTGDVEDNVIAIPPPPEYGNTRGSTLILANLLMRSNSARSNASGRSHGTVRQNGRSDADAAERGERHASQMSQMSGRPLSYVSRDEEWEQRRDDAERARVLENALSRLEDTSSRT